MVFVVVIFFIMFVQTRAMGFLVEHVLQRGGHDHRRVRSDRGTVAGVCGPRPAQFGGLREPREVFGCARQIMPGDIGREEAQERFEEPRCADARAAGGDDERDAALHQEPQGGRQSRIEDTVAQEADEIGRASCRERVSSPV